MACFCTLFNSAYLDKGMVMIESLKKHSPDSYIYVFAFDDKCYEVLNEINYDNVKLVSLKEFETEELLKIKKERTARAYCWTCTPYIIKHVLENRNEEIVTYIDADIMFFKNPEKLVNDVLNSGSDVGIMEHNFGKGKVQEYQLEIAGRYCVEFNTFVKNENGMKVLEYWRSKCKECCTDDVSQSSDGKFGDQMYLNDWTSRFENVYVHTDQGAGVAPWNLYRYRTNDNETILDIQSGNSYELSFYHYHGITMYDNGLVHIGVFGRYGYPDRDFVKYLYGVYLAKILKKRKQLKEDFNLDLDVKRELYKKAGIRDVIHIKTFIKRCLDTFSI